MKELQKVLRKQFDIFRDKKKEEELDEIHDWRSVEPKLVKKQCAKWRVWIIDDDDVNTKWKDHDRFVIYQDRDTLLYRDTAEKVFRSKGNLDKVIDIKPLVNKDYSIARFKAYIDKWNEVKTCRILAQLYKNKMTKPKVIDSDTSKSIKLLPNQLVSLIGAPGTGKSTKLASIVEKLHKTRKIIYFAPTHSQVSNFAKKLVNLKVEFAIMSDESKVEEQFIQKHRCNMEKIRNKYKNTIPMGVQVVLSTINKPIKFIYKANIEVALLDEASKISLLEAFTALFQIDTLKLLIIGGDNKQIACEGPRFSKMHNILEYADKRADVRLEVLRTYRLNSFATYLTSMNFYNGKLLCSKKGTGTVFGVIIRNNHKCTSKLSCDLEAEIAVLIARTCNTPDTVVITPYQDQARLIKNHSADCETMTVDASQGKEVKNVVFSFGRNTNRGFVSKQRINVATSRHTENLICLAHENVISTVPELAYIFRLLSEESKIFTF